MSVSAISSGGSSVNAAHLAQIARQTSTQDADAGGGKTEQAGRRPPPPPPPAGENTGAQSNSSGGLASFFTALTVEGDTDGDGILSDAEKAALTESSGSDLLVQVFSAVDTDGNGAVDDAEIAALDSALRSAGPQEGQGAGGPPEGAKGPPPSGPPPSGQGGDAGSDSDKSAAMTMLESILTAMSEASQTEEESSASLSRKFLQTLSDVSA